MKIECFESGPLLTNAYLIYDENSRHGVVIDAPFDCTAAIAEAVEREGITLQHVLLTHSHWDHTGDAAALKKKFSVPVSVHAEDEYRMVRPMDSIIPPPVPLAPMHADLYLKPDQEIQIGGMHLRILFTPGHTEGSVCFYEEQLHILFSGDTLFAGSVGRTDLPGGSWSTLTASLASLVETLPDDVAVYPGHGPDTTMVEEKMYNPFLNGSIIT